jgi:CubicO group peptidase (beta-lactamase class C family)
MSTQTTWALPGDPEIREILTHRIDVEGDGVGIVVGVIDAHGRRVVAHGATRHADGRTPDGATVFEIGSITKAFTALLLAEMAARGEVALDDPVAEYLPADVDMPRRGDAWITLAHLATHTSGLPRSPTNLSPTDQANPYANYTVEQLYAFLRAYELRREIGAVHLYSNLGSGLLGHVLALRAGVDFGTLIRDRITAPLGMASTGIALSPELIARMATGHDRDLSPVPYWDLPTLAGAGALRSTANDLLTFLAAELGHDQTPLAAAMAAQLLPRVPTETRSLQALGWLVLTDGAGEIAWHDGGTGGFRGFLGFDRGRGRGVAVLTNTASMRGAGDIGFHVLTGRPLQPRPVERHPVTIEPAILERYVGRYAFSPSQGMAVTREGERLFFQLTGRGRIELFAETPTDFFLKEVDAQVRFTTGPDGEVTGLVTRQAGQERPAKRTERAGRYRSASHPGDRAIVIRRSF